MDERFLKQVLAEMYRDMGDAIATFAVALSRQVDVQQLAADLRRQVEATRKVEGDTMACRMSQEVLAALDAELKLKQLDGQRPN